MSFSTASVTLGAPTRKADYDRLLQNDVAIASGSFTFYGAKVHNGTQLFKALSTFTATAVFSKPVRLNNTDNTIGMLTIDSAALAQNQIQTLAHGLGVQPRRVQVSLLCISAEYGFTEGQEIYNVPNYYDGPNYRIWQVDADATNFRTVINDITIYRKDAAAWVLITPSKWKFRIRYGL